MNNRNVINFGYLPFISSVFLKKKKKKTDWMLMEKTSRKPQLFLCSVQVLDL